MSLRNINISLRIEELRLKGAVKRRQFITSKSLEKLFETLKDGSQMK